ncbi:MAG: AAA family ATPase [Peptoniphilaceae bacterium]|nr:AAA family ATPase [Peptoniphilaceae bacterium]MDY6018421.1 AAA family ATPase [Anaerococcus sp.]
MNKLYIKEMNIISFGKFENLNIKFESGFNLIYGENESGKSTLVDFIEGVLYGFDLGKKRRNFSYKKEKYKPKLSYKYGGSILFSFNSSAILVERNFDNGKYRLIDKDHNKQIPAKASDLNYPGKYLTGLSYDSFQSLIKNFQSQKLARPSKEKLMEIFLDSSADLNFSATRAIENIEKNLDNLGSLRAYTKPYFLTYEKVKDLEEKNLELSNLKEAYKEDLTILYEQRKTLENYREKLKDLKNKRAAYRSSLAYDNYKKAEKTQRQLDIVNEKLKNYESYENVDQSYFDKIETLLDKESHEQRANFGFFLPLLFIIISLAIILLAYFTKKTLLLILLLALYPLYLLLKRNEFMGQNQIKELLLTYNLNDLASYRNFKKAYYDFLDLKKEKEKLKQILQILDKQEKKNTGLSIKMEFDISKLEEEISSLEDKYSSLSLKNIELEKKFSYIEEKLQDQQAIREDLSFYKKDLEKIQEEIKANKLAINLINLAKKDGEEKIKDLNKKIGKIIRQVSNGAYKEITYDKDLNPLIIKDDGSSIKLDQVSTGFFDQLNFALKLVLRENISPNKYIIFDDAFINYDEKRLTDALFFLLDLSKENQILYFTCHKREEEILSREEIYVNKIVLE